MKGFTLEQKYENALKLYTQGKFLEAIEVFLEILENNQNAEILNYLGMSYYAAGYLKESENYLLQAIRLDNTNAPYLTNLGILYSALQNFDLAQKYLIEALKNDEHYLDALINLSEVQRRGGDIQSAKGTLDKALLLDPSNVYVCKQSALLNRLAGNTSAAIGDYTRILNDFPDDLESLLKLAEIYVELSAYNEALNLYKKALALEPNLKHDLFLKGTLHQIYNKLFPADRFELYNNENLIQTIKKLLLSNEIKDKKITELQGVEGLLSFLCAKEGAHVTFIHQEEFFIQKAKLIAQNNNLESNMTFINKRTAYIEKDALAQQDMILTNFYAQELFDYENLMNLYNFKNRFLKKEGKIFPEEIQLKAQLIQSESLWKKGSADRVGEIDIRALNYYRPLYLYEQLEEYEHKVLSDTIDLHTFDLYARPQPRIQKKFTIESVSSGTGHAIVFWNRKYFDKQVLQGQNQTKCLVYLFDQPFDTKQGISKELTFVYSNIAMFFVD
jgi:tetratricopeptide (TPR) repeat protein